MREVMKKNRMHLTKLLCNLGRALEKSCVVHTASHLQRVPALSLCKLWGSLWRNGRRLLTYVLRHMRIPTCWANTFSWIRFGLVVRRHGCAKMIRLRNNLDHGKSDSLLEEYSKTKPVPLGESLIVGFETHQTALYITNKVRRSRRANPKLAMGVCNALVLGRIRRELESILHTYQVLPGFTF